MFGHKASAVEVNLNNNQDMKEVKTGHINNRDAKHHHRQFQFYTTKGIRVDKNAIAKTYFQGNKYEHISTREEGCQFDYKKDKFTRKKESRTRNMEKQRNYFSTLNQVYRYQGTRNIEDIGVGSIKALQRKRVKRVYLPETDNRGVGSTDLSSFIRRKNRHNVTGGYENHKKTSSKCIGGVIEFPFDIVNVKLSPIVKTVSGGTCTNTSPENRENTVTEMNTIESIMPNNIKNITKHIEVLNSTEKKDVAQADYKNFEGNPKKYIEVETSQVGANTKKTTDTVNQIIKKASSDSLLQRVHNLESPSDDKQIHMTVDPVENKLEKEYRQMFLTNVSEEKPSETKPMPDYKSISFFRRRFEALRRGLGKKKDSQNNSVVMPTMLSQVSRKDVSIASDPPSLEGRSYSNIKIYSPFQGESFSKNKMQEKSYTNRRDRYRLELEDSECQGVKGMFKLWGKKFNLEEEVSKKNITDLTEMSPNTKKETPKPSIHIEKKAEKEGKKFKFFRKKNKNKMRPYKSKKGVTAGRCEVKDGLTIKIGTNVTKSPSLSDPRLSEEVPEDYVDILRRAWLKKILSNKIESQNSMKVRWNNNTYTTSSSTVFELMDNVFKDTGVVFRSQSDMTTGDSSYRSNMRPRVNFYTDVEAWMVPETILDQLKVQKQNINDSDNREFLLTDNKWIIEKSKAFSHKIELVLHSKNLLKINHKDSSDFLEINIPKGFLSDSEGRRTSSDEKVYNIVEYETPNSVCNLKILSHTNDHKSRTKIETTKYLNMLEEVIKKPPVHRDVELQGSEVHIPKRCDVIGVGIITQRDIREMRKPILKIEDDFTDDESEQTLNIGQKKCEFAESYLQDYYRNWTPLGIDMYSWCVSDSHVRCCSENQSNSSLNDQGDASKSCPNIYDDFQTSTIVSSCATSSCSCCRLEPEIQKDEKQGFFNKFKKRSKSEPLPKKDCGRILPKDSKEVFRRRKLYAASNKSKWVAAEDRPYGVSSSESKGAQDTLKDCPKMKKPCCKPVAPKAKSKSCKKHVSLPDCDAMNDMLAKQLNDKIDGILSFKGQSCTSEKSAKVTPTPQCEIKQLPCKPTCEEKNRASPCSKAGAPSCDPMSPHYSSSSSSTSKQSQPGCGIPPCVPKTPLPPIKPEKCPLKQDTTEKKQKATPETSPCPSERKISCECRLTKNTSKCPCSVSSRAKDSPSNSPKRLNQPPPGVSKCACRNRTSSHSLLSYVKEICNKGTSNQSSPKRSPRCSPKCSKQISIPNSNTKSPIQGTQSTNLCEQCKKSTGDDYPWPIKKQVSNIFCKGKCPCVPTVNKKISARSIDSNKINNCKPDCANMTNKQPTPPPPPQECPPCNQSPKIKQPSPISYAKKCKSKISGLFLKINPSKKKNTCSKECLTAEKEQNVIRLNSKEKITIRMKTDTPSTQEIREGLNIKVQDADGITLYERKDYKCKNKPSVLGDVYKDSNIQRVSTATAHLQKPDNQVQAKESRSDTSLVNIVEIQFKLKINQGDKTTEINIGNDGDTEKEKQDKSLHLKKSPQEIYLMKNSIKDSSPMEDLKNDINIRILIKNFKPKSDRKHVEINGENEEFSRNIYKKFHTVSTGDSDIDQNEELGNVFSVQRTTVDLSSSAHDSKNKTSAEMSEGLTDNEPYMMSSFSAIEKSGNEESLIKVQSSYKRIRNDNTIVELSASKLESYSKISDDFRLSKFSDDNQTSATETDNPDFTLEIYNSNDDYKSTEEIIKPKYNQEKKEALKMIMKNASRVKNSKNKKNIRQLKDMLKIILTSDSETEEIVSKSNQLAKELTYESLKPNFFRNTDSMNNYYNIGSDISTMDDKKERLCPTKQNSLEKCLLEEKKSYHGCICSTIAAGLSRRRQEAVGGCCCRRMPVKSETTSCNLRTDDLVHLSIKTESHECETTEIVNDSLPNETAKTVSTYITTYQSELTKVCDDATVDEKFVRKTFSPHTNHIKPCEMKRLNRNTILSITEDDKVMVMNPEPAQATSKQVKHDTADGEIRSKGKFEKYKKPADILQSYESKKAVLKIYAEKTVTREGDRVVAKLPKFVYGRENQIKHTYDKIIENSYKSMCKGNLVMMSIKR